MTSCITKALLIYYRVHAYPDQLRFIFFAGSWIIWTYMVSLFSFSSSNRQMSLYRSVFVFDELIPASTKMIQPIALIKSLASHSLVWAAPFLRLRSISGCSSCGRYFTASIFEALVAMCMENVYRNRNIQLHNRDLIAIFCPCKMVKINKLLNIPHSWTIHLSNGDTARKSKPLEL